MHTDALPFHPRRRQGLCCRTEQALGTVGGGDCCGLHFSRPTAECVRPAQSTERSGLLRVPEPGETVSPLPGQLRGSLFRTGSLEWLACHPRPRFGFLRPLMKSSPQEVSDLLKICWSHQHPEGNVAAMNYGFDARVFRLHAQLHQGDAPIARLALFRGGKQLHGREQSTAEHGQAAGADRRGRLIEPARCWARISGSMHRAHPVGEHAAVDKNVAAAIHTSILLRNGRTSARGILQPPPRNLLFGGSFDVPAHRNLLDRRRVIYLIQNKNPQPRGWGFF